MRCCGGVEEYLEASAKAGSIPPRGAMYELQTQGRWRVLEYLDAILTHLEPVWKATGETFKHLSHVAHVCEKANHACERAVEAYAPWSIVAIVVVVGGFFIAHLKSH
jgi:hypothetical protein